ncbi:hypothetical protein ABKN59_011002 [Abortiporus biennis]
MDAIVALRISSEGFPWLCLWRIKLSSLLIFVTFTWNLEGRSLLSSFEAIDVCPTSIDVQLQSRLSIASHGFWQGLDTIPLWPIYLSTYIVESVLPCWNTEFIQFT